MAWRRGRFRLKFFVGVGRAGPDQPVAVERARRTFQRHERAQPVDVFRPRILAEGKRDAVAELFAAERPLTFSLAAGGWQVIGLDSQDTGEIAGRIDSAQLEWLRHELERGDGAPALVFLHHPPVPVGVEWLDRIGLQDPQALLDLLERFPRVRAVCSGHVHREHLGRIGAAAFFTTPSTCTQFGAGPEMGYDPVPAGYRTFTLDGDEVRSAVHRLSTLR